MSLLIIPNNPSQFLDPLLYSPGSVKFNINRWHEKCVHLHGQSIYQIHPDVSEPLNQLEIRKTSVRKWYLYLKEIRSDLCEFLITATEAFVHPLNSNDSFSLLYYKLKYLL